MIKGLIKQENMTILNLYKWNKRVSKYKKQKWIDPKGEIYKSVITVRNFSISHSKLKELEEVENQEEYRWSE